MQVFYRASLFFVASLWKSMLFEDKCQPALKKWSVLTSSSKVAKILQFLGRSTTDTEKSEVFLLDPQWLPTSSVQHDFV